MAEETLLQRLQREISQKKFEKTSLEAYKWLRGRITDITGSLGGSTLKDKLIKQEVKSGNVLKGDPSAIQIGSMICYGYNPKHRDTLPYYDMFPVGFLVGVTKRGSWQMLNLHYLPPKYRALLFDKLMTVANNKKFDKTTKLRLSYNILMSASKFALFKPCFKEYLPNHVMTKIIKIQPSDWSTVMFLPLAQFKGASASKVWSDSVRGKK